MGDVIPLVNKDTPKMAAEQALENIEDSDLTFMGMIVTADGEITITSSPMSSERMHYLGGILQNFALNYAT